MAGLNASERVRLVLNRVRKSDEINERDIEKALRQPVAWKVGNDYQACMEAVNSGKAVLPASSKHLVKDFREMSHQLAGHQTQERRKGFRALIRLTGFGITGMQMHDGGAGFGGIDRGIRDFLWRYRQCLRHRGGVDRTGHGAGDDDFPAHAWLTFLQSDTSFR